MDIVLAHLLSEIDRLRGENARLAATAGVAPCGGRPAAGSSRAVAGEDGAERWDSGAFYRELFEVTPFPIGVYDLDTLRFLTVNEAMVRQLGYTREELAAMTVADIQSPHQYALLEEWIPQFRKDPRPRTMLVHLHRKDGTVLDVEVSGAGIRYAGRNARVVTVHDVTHRVQLEEALRRSQKLEGIGRLAGGVAHDFNNLLTAIIGYTQMLEDRFTHDPAVMEDLSEIRCAGHAARDLTKQLLAVARRQVSAPRVLDLSDVVARKKRLLMSVIGEHVQIETTLACGLWPIAADPAQIDQILVNLAVNARDAMPTGGTLRFVTANRPEVMDEFTEPGFVPGPYVLLEVNDTGVGMPAETLNHVFEPFFTTKPIGQGTGLGLATVYGIVRQAGGHVAVHSEVGRGTAFRLYFPRAAVDWPCDASSAAETVATSAP